MPQAGGKGKREIPAPVYGQGGEPVSWPCEGTLTGGDMEKLTPIEEAVLKVVEAYASHPDVDAIKIKGCYAAVIEAILAARKAHPEIAPQRN